ncbi:hypothetical protein Nmel_012878, partial [Mimus melanotis]
MRGKGGDKEGSSATWGEAAERRASDGGWERKRRLGSERLRRCCCSTSPGVPLPDFC